MDLYLAAILGLLFIAGLLLKSIIDEVRNDPFRGS